MPGQFLTNFTGTELEEFGGIWSCGVPALVYRSDLLRATLKVPVGFLTDFASVPRVLGIYDLEGGKCNKAAVIHDLLYSIGCENPGTVDRDKADEVLREAILASGYSAFTAGAFYAAVRVGGQARWDQENIKQTPEVQSALYTLAAFLKIANEERTLRPVR